MQTEKGVIAMILPLQSFRTPSSPFAFRGGVGSRTAWARHGNIYIYIYIYRAATIDFSPNEFENLASKNVWGVFVFGHGVHMCIHILYIMVGNTSSWFLLHAILPKCWRVPWWITTWWQPPEAATTTWWGAAEACPTSCGPLVFSTPHVF